MEDETLCWTCDHACPDYNGRGCSWSMDLKPVKGWKAIRNDIIGWNGYKHSTRVESYRVVFCPKYKKDEHSIQYEKMRKEKDKLLLIAKSDYNHEQYEIRKRLASYNGGEPVQRAFCVYRGGNGFQIQRCLTRINQEVAGKLIGIQKSTLARIETGDLRHVDNYVFLRASRVYGCSIEDLKRNKPTEVEMMRLLNKHSYAERGE